MPNLADHYKLNKICGIHLYQQIMCLRWNREGKRPCEMLKCSLSTGSKNLDCGVVSKLCRKKICTTLMMHGTKLNTTIYCLRSYKKLVSHVLKVKVTRQRLEPR